MATSTAPRRLVRLQKMAGISRRELARLADLSESCVRLFQSRVHSSMTSGSISRLAAVVGVTIDYLLHGTGSEPTEEQVKASVEAARAKRKPARRRTARPAAEAA